MRKGLAGSLLNILNMTLHLFFQVKLKRNPKKRERCLFKPASIWQCGWGRMGGGWVKWYPP